MAIVELSRLRVGVALKRYTLIVLVVCVILVLGFCNKKSLSNIFFGTLDNGGDVKNIQKTKGAQEEGVHPNLARIRRKFLNKASLKQVGEYHEIDISFQRDLGKWLNALARFFLLDPKNAHSGDAEFMDFIISKFHEAYGKGLLSVEDLFDYLFDTDDIDLTTATSATLAMIKDQEAVQVIVREALAGKSSHKQKQALEVLAQHPKFEEETAVSLADYLSLGREDVDSTGFAAAIMPTDQKFSDEVEGYVHTALSNAVNNSENHAVLLNSVVGLSRFSKNFSDLKIVLDALNSDEQDDDVRGLAVMSLLKAQYLDKESHIRVKHNMLDLLKRYDVSDELKRDVILMSLEVMPLTASERLSLELEKSEVINRILDEGEDSPY